MNPCRISAYMVEFPIRYCAHQYSHFLTLLLIQVHRTRVQRAVIGLVAADSSGSTGLPIRTNS